MINFFIKIVAVVLLILFQNAYSEQSMPSSLAEKSLILASSQSNSLSVVAGEKGHILYSYNNQEWHQAIVPTRQTLTNIFMLDESTGWAVGHDAIILKTNDGAKTWKKVFSDIKEEAPLLDLFFKDALNGIAVGAYSLMYHTTDGGNSWQKKNLNLTRNTVKNSDKAVSEIIDVEDFHFNAIASAGNKRLYITAEAGHILRSDDEGGNWLELTSPYRGSFFGVLPLSYTEVLVYGLRGHLYRSSDAGNSWESIETNTEEMLTDATQLSNGNILITGFSVIFTYE